MGVMVVYRLNNISVHVLFRYHVLPDWYIHIHDLPSDDVAVTGTYSTKRPIMGFDNLSTWQRYTFL